MKTDIIQARAWPPRHYGVAGELWSAPPADALPIILTVLLASIEYGKNPPRRYLTGNRIGRNA